VALIESYIPHQSDAWKLALDELDRFLEGIASSRMAPAVVAAGTNVLFARPTDPYLAEHCRGWLELSDYEAAVRCFRAAGDLARTALALGHLHEAAGEWSRAAAAYRAAGKKQASQRCRARAHEEAGRHVRAARLWERLGETGRAFGLYVRAESWADVARLEEVKPEPHQNFLPKVRAMVEARDWRTAGPLVQTRMDVLRGRLPEMPWFVFDEEQPR